MSDVISKLLGHQPMSIEERNLLASLLGYRPRGTVYATMCPPADSFEASDYGNWYPVWWRAIDDYGHTQRISVDEAKAHFEALGQPMPKPEVPRR